MGRCVGVADESYPLINPIWILAKLVRIVFLYPLWPLAECSQ